MATSHVSRTIRWLAEEGYARERIEIVERYNAATRRRHDAWGIFDLLVINPPDGILGVQVCGEDFKPHLEKMKDAPIMDIWLIQNTALLIGWRKQVWRRGSSRMVYRPRPYWFRRDSQGFAVGDEQ